MAVSLLIAFNLREKPASLASFAQDEGEGEGDRKAKGPIDAAAAAAAAADAASSASTSSSAAGPESSPHPLLPTTPSLSTTAAVAAPMTMVEIMGKVGNEPRLWLLYASTALATPTFDLPSILPLLLSEHVAGMPAATVGFLASLFPLVAVPATLLGASLDPRMTPAQRPYLYVAGQTVTALSLAYLSRPKLTAARVGVALMCCMGGCAPSLYVAPQAFLMRFGGPYTGTFAGLLDAFGNLLMTGV